jgi:hypothetical protein
MNKVYIIPLKTQWLLYVPPVVTFIKYAFTCTTYFHVPFRTIFTIILALS